MHLYTKFTITCLLCFSIQISNAQKDTLLTKNKPAKVEIGIVPASIYLVPDYFKNKINSVYVVGLQSKFYTSANNAIRLVFTTNNFAPNKDLGGTKLKQYNIGFQHTFFSHKKINIYWFADLYYQTFSANSSFTYSNFKTPPGYLYGSYDSTQFIFQKVNSYNLVVGAGFRFLDRKHLFFSVETGIGISYYNSGSQQMSGLASTIYSNQYQSPTSAQHTFGPSYDNFHQLPQADTKVKGINLNASVIRLALGVVF